MRQIARGCGALRCCPRERFRFRFCRRADCGDCARLWPACGSRRTTICRVASDASPISPANSSSRRGSRHRVDADRSQLSGHVRRQSLGRRRRPRRGRLRRRPVPARAATPISTCRVSTIASSRCSSRRAASIVRVRVLDPGESARIDTPNTQVQLTRPGLYRIDVHAGSARRRVSRCAKARRRSRSPAGVQQALPGQTVIVSRHRTPSVADVRNGVGSRWLRHVEREPRSPLRSAIARRRTSRGRWSATPISTTTAPGRATPDYGPVWYPDSGRADDWAPYATATGRRRRLGHTWVDAAPWGYAPFHYGRWAFVGGRWGWCPGAYVARPVWAPALVGWYGGAGWAVVGKRRAPVYGWVPLGWGEPYHPWWHRCSYSCWTRYNRPYAVERFRARQRAAGPAVRERRRAGRRHARSPARRSPGGSRWRPNRVAVPPRDVSRGAGARRGAAVSRRAHRHVPAVRAGARGIAAAGVDALSGHATGPGRGRRDAPPRRRGSGRRSATGNAPGRQRVLRRSASTIAPCSRRRRVPQRPRRSRILALGARAPGAVTAANPAGSQNLSRQAPSAAVPTHGEPSRDRARRQYQRNAAVGTRRAALRAADVAAAVVGCSGAADGVTATSSFDPRRRQRGRCLSGRHPRRARIPLPPQGSRGAPAAAPAPPVAAPAAGQAVVVPHGSGQPAPAHPAAAPQESGKPAHAAPAQGKSERRDVTAAVSVLPDLQRARWSSSRPARGACRRRRA